MSDAKNSPEREPMQFDTAEPVEGASAAATALACTVCNAEITTSYYEVNGEIACVSCRAKLRAQFTGGSGSARFAKAIGFGLAAAAAGSAIYYAVLALTGYEIGLVAIIVGFIVGRAVNRGSQGRGGRAYQVLAVGLTYFAIVTTYIPLIMKSAREQHPAIAAAADSARARADSVTTAAAATPEAQLQGAPSGASAPVATGSGSAGITALQVLIGVVALLAFAAAVPILAGFENIIGMLIIGFALFEAWRQNQRIQLAITGPYRVGAARDGNAPGAASG
jgi:hypothetical protein